MALHTLGLSVDTHLLYIKEEVAHDDIIGTFVSLIDGIFVKNVAVYNYLYHFMHLHFSFFSYILPLSFQLLYIIHVFEMRTPIERTWVILYPFFHLIQAFRY